MEIKPDNVNKFIISKADRVLVTGAGGFLGLHVVEQLIAYGFQNIRCLARSPASLENLKKIKDQHKKTVIEIFQGDLLSRDLCKQAADQVKVIYHLAAGADGKSFAGSYLKSVVTTNNLINAFLSGNDFKRFVNVGSFASYSNSDLKPHALLDESCHVHVASSPDLNPYTFAKIEQDNLVIRQGHERGLPWVILRPGAIYGPGAKEWLTSRVGIDTFGFFMHLGGKNQLPLTYVKNCADAVVRAGLIKGIEHQIFNVIDDDLPQSAAFLNLYKQNVKNFFSLTIPYRLFYLFSFLWEKYSIHSKGQIPMAFNRNRTASMWKGNTYSNQKAKAMLDWQPGTPTQKAFGTYFNYMKKKLSAEKSC